MHSIHLYSNENKQSQNHSHRHHQTLIPSIHGWHQRSDWSTSSPMDSLLQDQTIHLHISASSYSLRGRILILVCVPLSFIPLFSSFPLVRLNLPFLVLGVVCRCGVLNGRTPFFNRYSEDIIFHHKFEQWQDEFYCMDLPKDFSFFNLLLPRSLPIHPLVQMFSFRFTQRALEFYINVP